MSGIRVSEKHGVNPTIPICFWCGKEKNEIALLGKLPGDKEAPRRAIIDYNPCEECQKEMNKGISFIEVSKNPIMPNQPAISHGMYPTSKIAIIDEESVKRAIKDKDMADQILSSKKCIIDSESWNAMGLPKENIKKEVKEDGKK